METSYSRCLKFAEQSKADHAERSRQQVYAAAQRCRGCFDDGRGGIDSIKIESHAARDWWIDPHKWIPGKARTFTLDTHLTEIFMHGLNGLAPEVEAVRNVRHDAKQLSEAR